MPIKGLMPDGTTGSKLIFFIHNTIRLALHLQEKPISRPD